MPSPPMSAAPSADKIASDAQQPASSAGDYARLYRFMIFCFTIISSD